MLDSTVGVKVQTFYDQSTLVRDSIRSVGDAILIGLIFAAIILVLFLRDWGSSLVAGLVIPASMSRREAVSEPNPSGLAARAVVEYALVNLERRGSLPRRAA